ncbi:MAG TPA: pilus assembly protein N-terminal domain-containing protein [Candidatus Binatia bacterium]|nr:pilus assembly protein N-terminal domain-containing protein [Candidatus Binatia bacterium]
MPSRLRRAAPWILPIVLSLLLAGRPTVVRAADAGLLRLDVTIGKSQVLTLQEPFNRVSVTNPAIADVFVVTPNQILINGKAVGTTSLVVFHPARTVFFDLVVQTDLALLRERLKQVAPRDDIRVHAAQDAIILDGSASSDRTIAAAAEVAAVFAPRGKVVNLVSLADARPQQVLLQVHVAEVARGALRELGFNFRALGTVFQAAAFPGIPFVNPLGTVGPVTQGGFAGVRQGSGSISGSAGTITTGGPDFPFAGGNFFFSSGQRDYAGIVRALAERNLLRTLAKPNLVTQSGREAKFLSGGEFPFPVAQQNNTVTVEFKEFGVGLVFTPTVVDGETINLKVRPEVSNLDFSQGLVSAGFRIPVVRKNEAATTIAVKDGESFAIAGLINNEVRQAVQKVPLLGDIPILGALFRSASFQNNETELLFLVTVKLIKPGPPGAAPDPTRLMELRDTEKKEFTLVPGLPGVGEVVDRPFGQSNLPPR